MVGIPIITQSDPGTENNGVANAHTMIRHRLDPNLANTLQHRFTTGHNNILSEIKWSVFRQDFSPRFEDTSGKPDPEILRRFPKFYKKIDIFLSFSQILKT